METAGVYPLVRPRGVSAHFVRFSSGDYIIGIGEEKTLEISAQYDIIEKVEISMPCKLMLARRSFFALRHRRGRKNNVQNQVRLPAGVPAADLCGRSVLPICILRTHGRAHAYLRRGTTGDFGRICWIMSGNREIGRMHI